MKIILLFVVFVILVVFVMLYFWQLPKNNLPIVTKINTETKIPPEPIKFKAAIIIDDVGYKNGELENFLALGIPLTFSILPFEKYSGCAADELSEQNCEFMLHQPMEAEGHPKINPGKAAVYLKMSADEIKQKVLKNLENVEGAVGVNNHMGSAFTCDKIKMTEFLEVIKEKNLIFVDSLTSPRSVAYQTAKEMGIASLRNGVFLDNEDSLKYILGQLSLFEKRIKRHGGCVAIGHIHRKNLTSAIAKIIPEFRKEGITFVNVSEAVERE